MKNVDMAFAILRVNYWDTSDATRTTVKRVVWDADLAQSEVDRLNALNGDKDCLYVWQHTRVDKRDA